MPQDDADLPSAARRVAEDMRRGGAPRLSDVDILLPILDAVAADPDADRVERWARAMCAQEGYAPDRFWDGSDERRVWREQYLDRARAAIALADAEAAGRREAGWRAYEEARDRFGSANDLMGVLQDGEDNGFPDKESHRNSMLEDRAALDVAVRRLAGTGTANVS